MELREDWRTLVSNIFCFQVSLRPHLRVISIAYFLEWFPRFAIFRFIRVLGKSRANGGSQLETIRQSDIQDASKTGSKYKLETSELVLKRKILHKQR